MELNKLLKDIRGVFKPPKKKFYLGKGSGKYSVKNFKVLMKYYHNNYLMMNIWKIKDFFRNIKYYFKNIIKWSPILWEDRDWDHYHIMNTLRFKIEKTAKYITKHQRYVGYERDVERMNLVIRLIDKMQDEYYTCEYQDYYKSDFRFEKIENTELSTLYFDVLEDNLEEYFEKYPNTYKLFSEHTENIKKALRMGNHLHTKCKRILFKLIEQNIEKWWD